jgi:hypothetical protein
MNIFDPYIMAIRRYPHGEGRLDDTFWHHDISDFCHDFAVPGIMDGSSDGETQYLG